MQRADKGSPAAMLRGLVLLLNTGAVLAFEWHVHPLFGPVSAALVLLVLVMSAPDLKWSRAAFLLAGLALAGLIMVLRTDWQAILLLAAERGAFIAAFFVALAMLRIPAAHSPAIERCGIYLTEQPPGRRYLALTAGGHVFGLLLNYGAITLLGTLVESTNRGESSEEIRRIRTRRMLLAIQRGFISILCWSPLGFSMAITITVVPGASWSAAVGLALVSSIIMIVTGWALDSAFKPRLSGPRPAARPARGTWRDLRPLFLLLLILGIGVTALELATGLRIIAVVMLVVPLMSLGWLMLQGSRTGEGLGHARRHVTSFVTADAPSYSSEIVLLVMAGFIGTLGGELISPLLREAHFSAAGLPVTALLIAIVWLLPLLGQIGMNPILAVSLFAPLLGALAATGVSPTAIVVAVTSGWALSGVTSPYTATVLLVAKLGGVRPYYVGWGWNGLFTLVSGLFLSLWVAVLAQI